MFILRQNRFTRNRFAYKNSPKINTLESPFIFIFPTCSHALFSSQNSSLYTIYQLLHFEAGISFYGLKEAVCVLYENSFFSQTSFVSFLSSRKRPPSNEHRPYCLLTLFPAHWTHSLPFQKSPLLKRCAFLFFPFY
jgi:hypothetical protein